MHFSPSEQEKESLGPPDLPSPPPQRTPKKTARKSKKKRVWHGKAKTGSDAEAQQEQKRQEEEQKQLELEQQRKEKQDLEAALMATDSDDDEDADDINDMNMVMERLQEDIPDPFRLCHDAEDYEWLRLVIMEQWCVPRDLSVDWTCIYQDLDHGCARTRLDPFPYKPPTMQNIDTIHEQANQQKRYTLSVATDATKYKDLRKDQKKLKFNKSPIHDWGLFATAPILRHDFVIEYLGESIRQQVANRREREYEQSGIGSSYLFRVDDDMVVDATVKGNLARFINHCCTVKL